MTFRGSRVVPQNMARRTLSALLSARLAPAVVLAALAGFGCQRATMTGPPGSHVTVAPPAIVLGGSGHGLPNTPPPFATPPMLPGTVDVATLAAKVKGSVVSITTLQRAKPPSYAPPGYDDAPMEQHALGSGFLVDFIKGDGKDIGKDIGHVVTNAHVVEGAERVRVRLADDREIEARVKGRDRLLDLAVLELAPTKDLPPPVSLGSSADLRVGEYVVAIGNPFGLGHTVTAGIVSAKGRTIGAGPYDDFIQTDASINPGNSGGPLFDTKGEVIGINTAINPNGKGIGFAIPSDALREVLPSLVKDGKVERGRLGVHIQGIDAPLAKALGLESAKGALVADVEPNGPGASAGLLSGDVILAIDGEEVTHATDLPRLVAKHGPGAKVTLKLMRKKAPLTLDVTLAALGDGRPTSDEEEDQQEPAAATPKPSGKLGIKLGDTVDGVVVLSVAKNAPAEGELLPGDEILAIDGTEVNSTAATAKAIGAAKSGTAVLIEVRRGGERRFVGVQLG